MDLGINGFLVKPCALLHRDDAVTVYENVCVHPYGSYRCHQSWVLKWGSEKYKFSLDKYPWLLEGFS